VNVVNPITTQFAEIALFVEKRMKQMRSKRNRGPCDLTQASQRKLEVNVRGLVDEVRSMYKSGSLEKVRLQQVKQFFLLFEKYFSFGHVQRLIDDYNELIQQCVLECEQIIEDELEKGTSMRSNETFSTANVLRLTESLYLLDILSDEFSIDSYTRKISVKVKLFQNQMLGEYFDSVELKLNKLRAWCDFSPLKLNNFYNEVISHLSIVIQELGHTVETFEIYHLRSGTHMERVRDFLDCLRTLKLFGLCSSVHGLPIEKASLLVSEKLNQIEQMLIEWRRLEEASDAVFLHCQNMFSVEALGSQVETLLVMLDVFQVKLDSPRIVCLLEQVLELLVNNVADSFNTACSNFKKCLDDFFEGNESSDPLELARMLSCLKNMTDLASKFAEGKMWNHICLTYLSLIDDTTNALRTIEGKCQKMAQIALMHGVRDGKLDVQYLLAFESCKWFDSFLPQEKTFIGCCSTAIKQKYEERGRTLKERFNVIFRTLLRGSGKNSKLVSEMDILKAKPVLAEVKELTSFGSTVNSDPLQKLTHDVQDCLDEYVACRCGHWAQVKCEWEKTIQIAHEDMVGQDLFNVNESMNNCLSEIQALLELGLIEKSRSLCLTMDSELRRSLIDFAKTIDSLLDSNASFETTYKTLKMLESLGEFLLTSQHLPSFKEHLNLAQARVSNLVERIGELVDKTAEIEESEHLLSELMEAQILKPFLDQDISNTICALTKLLTKKEKDVDEVISSMIEQKNFQGMKQFLLPYSKATDQVRRTRYQHYLSKIQDSLRVIDDTLVKAIEQPTTERNVTVIEEHFKMLDDASSEIGSLMQMKFDLNSRLFSAKTQVKHKLMSMLDKLDSAIAKIDFVIMQNLTNKTAIYIRHLERYVPVSIKTKQQKSMRKYQDLVASLEPRIETFVKSEFKDEQELIVILDRLRAADEQAINITISLYTKTSKKLERSLAESLESIKDFVGTYQTYDSSIESMQSLLRMFQNGLQRHVVSALMTECEELLQTWQKERQQQELQMDFRGSSAKENLDIWARRLENLDPRFNNGSWAQVAKKSFGTFFNRDAYVREYEAHKRHLQSKANKWCMRAERSLDNRDYARMQDHFDILLLMKVRLSKHLPTLEKSIVKLRSSVLDHFVSHCKKCISALQSEDFVKFKSLFPNYQDCLLYVKCLDFGSKDIKKSSELIHQLLFELLDKKINCMLQSMKTFEFCEIKANVLDVRFFGGFVADHISLLRQKMEEMDHMAMDKWLDDIMTLIHKHFAGGRDLGGIKYFAILGVLPSSPPEAILRKAFKTKSFEFHPDKNRGQEEEFKEKFQRVNEAYDEIQKRAAALEGLQRSLPFEEDIKAIPSFLRQRVKNALNDQDYEQVETLHFKFTEFRLLEGLVTPQLETEVVFDDIFTLVRDHVQKARTKINTYWKERKYQELNHGINDLRSMETTLSAEIFGDSWSSSGVVETIESEIISLAQESRQYLIDKKTAKECRDDFRRCFMGMGTVMVELPLFKDICRKTMSDVLESCLSNDWGYEYLFDFGNRLQRECDAMSDDDKRIAHIVLSEFSTFKDVMTMIWNEEVEQKPPEVTIPQIIVQTISGTTASKQPLGIEEQAHLFDSFEIFDQRYQLLLMEFLQPDKDLSLLVQKIVSVADSLKPVSCQNLTVEVKRAIPEILSGVFTVFTVLKSGESYNRLEESSIDQHKVLMRPHNIQVQTLLAIFGCEDPTLSKIQSRLMQIRTGEGKSMILGAASLVLGLLGFSVCCVCYSEYLSSRDYEAFRDVFDIFGLASSIKYSKITTLSEDATTAKGDLRGLTLSLIRGNHMYCCNKSSLPSSLKTSQFDHTATLTDMENQKDIYFQTTRSENSSDDDTMANNLSLPNPNLAGIDEIVFNSTDAVALTSQERNKASRTTLNVRPNNASHNTEEILLIDEVDVFFSSEFYGNTYNKAAMLREPTIVELLKTIWAESKHGSKRLRLSFVKQLSSYKELLVKFPGFEFLLENEVRRMLDEVRRVDETPYHLDITTDRIGHKIMDTIDYDVNFGYATVFAYLKEVENLKNPDSTLNRELVIKVSCGQFSYANISPTAILGVSGTLEVMDTYQKNVLQRYGVESFFYLPSVYGSSRFIFQPGADPSSVLIEKELDEYFLKITEVAVNVARLKRAVIVFFADTERLNRYVSSAFYRKLPGRNKNILKEDMSKIDKEFVIQRAATVGQITISSAVFGRGTDFFCKDETVEKNGGVHVVQTFLSAELSEEIQIQGRTARQGKKGTYSMVLLETDLKESFDADVEKWGRNEYYDKLNETRKRFHESHCRNMEINLNEATIKDQASHEYFDALLDNNSTAVGLFKDLYLGMKKQSAPDIIDIDLCLAVDNTGSMRRYGYVVKSTVSSLIEGESSFLPKLQVKFPDTVFKVRLGLLSYRDIDDGNNQFNLCTEQFTESSQEFMHCLDQVVANASGGGDICEDHLGAIHHLTQLSWEGCWKSSVKAVLLITDAPGHGCLPQSYSPSADSYSVRHPKGLTASSVVGNLLRNNIDLFICSLNPEATILFETEIHEAFSNHVDNKEECEAVSVPLVKTNPKIISSAQTNSNKHIIFVLDESGSMGGDWGGVVVAYNNYKEHRLDQQLGSDLVSVIQFDDSARLTVHLENIASAEKNLSYSGGGTNFTPAALTAHIVAMQTPTTHTPLVVFMSDGMANDEDAKNAANTFVSLNSNVKMQHGDDLELHVIGFGNGTDTSQLRSIANASAKGSLHTAPNLTKLSEVFVQIAGGKDVANVLEEEIGKRIYDAVTDRLSAEYAG
jgi:uncharacterized protein YegL